MAFDNIDLTSGGNQTMYTRVNIYTDDSKTTLVDSSEAAATPKGQYPDAG